MRILKIALVISAVVVGLSAQSGGKQFVRPARGQDLPFSAAIRAGGFVYVSGMMATDVTGDITAQPKQIFENLRGVLQQAGSLVDHIAVATVTLEQAQDLAAFDEIFQAQFMRAPPARTTLVGNMVRPGALVEIAVTAVPTGVERKAIRPPGWMPPHGPYSYAIQSGDTLFLSGMVSRNMTDLSAVRGDIATQTKKVMDNAAELLKAAGMSLDDIVTSRASLRNIAEFRNMGKVYAAYWDVRDLRATGVVPGRPARASVGLDPVAPFDLDITFVAVKGSSPREVVIPPHADGSPGQLPGGSSPAIQVGNRIWVAGTTGSTPENRGDIKAQTTEVLTRLGRSLKAAGFDFEDVVAVEVWMSNRSQVNDMNEVYRAVFPTDLPVRKTVGAEPLGAGTALIAAALMAVK